jgi:hypothetical protein
LLRAHEDWRGNGVWLPPRKKSARSHHSPIPKIAVSLAIGAQSAQVCDAYLSGWLVRETTHD